MAAIPYGLTRSDLLLWLANIVGRLGGNELVPVPGVTQDAFETDIEALRVALAAADADASAALNDYHAAIAVCTSVQAVALDKVQQFKYVMRGSDCPGSSYALAGFSVPVTDPVSYVAQVPSGLAVLGFSNGVNKLAFDGNNTPGLVTYMVLCQIGDSTTMELVGSTTKQKWSHTGVIPGVQYVYTVFARAASNDSAVSNEAMVYGV